jgi:hypothetical protein
VVLKSGFCVFAGVVMVVTDCYVAGMVTTQIEMVRRKIRATIEREKAGAARPETLGWLGGLLGKCDRIEDRQAMVGILKGMLGEFQAKHTLYENMHEAEKPKEFAELTDRKPSELSRRLDRLQADMQQIDVWITTLEHLWAR